ncbi:MAG: DUF3320 domain-containing protein [Magnetococcales bacterium]|nr:DUF3320 domain-containing protein [Magnetococcales bacterium]
MSLDDVTGQLIADLRIRLLDLSNRNRLLNYKHAERSKTQVRVVDEQPDFLHDCLTSGKGLSFRSLPEPENELPDEKTDDFLMVLEEEHRLDPEWIDMIKEEEDIASTMALKLDRAIRDRVRVKLGLPPAKGGRLLSIGDWARINGIEPSYDLPRPSVTDEEEEKHTDREIQTLLLPDDMQGKLAGVMDNARTAQQEMGVNLLHMAIGFLEWVETPQAVKSMIAPLLLYPVELVRKPMKAKGQYRYFLRGESEPIINITLRQRLDKDHNLSVPEVEDGDTAESYMDKVARVIEGMARWRVRRFSTLGLFSFSRLVMYNDLDPPRWGNVNGLAGAGVLDELFGRKDAGNPNAEVYDIEDPAIEAEVPLLIRDADSSQHQAIIDVMRGHNLVIKGPPGTGKSQTIANIIAAALAKKLHVLFIAEKAAALDVVKKRLDDAGLGEFCFELHSTKARKTEVLKGLERRLNINPEKASGSIEAAIGELRSLRDRLTKHALTMNLPFSALEVSERGTWRRATIYDILWAEQRTRTAAPRFPSLDRVVLPNAMETTRFDVERRRDRLTTIERIVAEVVEQFGGVGSHPWSFVTRPTIQVLDVSEIVDASSLVQESLAHLGKDVGALVTFGVRIPDDLMAIQEFAQNLASLPVLEARADDGVLRLVLDDPSREKAVSAIADNLEDRIRSLGECNRCFVSGSTTLTPEAAAELACNARALGVADLTLDQLEEKAGQVRIELTRWNKVIDLVNRLLDVFGIRNPPTPRVLRLVGQASDMLARTDRAALLGRLPSVVEETACGVLERAQVRIAELRTHDAELRERLVFDASITVVDLRHHAGVLKTTGMFGKLGGEYKAAKKMALAMLRNPETFVVAEVSGMLIELAEHLEALLAFENDQSLRSVCQHRFMGLTTDIDALLAANSFSSEVRRAFAGLDDAEAAARHFLLHGDIENLDGLASLAADVRFNDLRKAIDEATDPDMDLSERCMDLERYAHDIATLRESLMAGGLHADATPAQAEEVAPIFERIRKLEAGLATQSPILLADAWCGHDTDPEPLRMALKSANALRVHSPDCGLCKVIAAQSDVPKAVQLLRNQGDKIRVRAKDAKDQLVALLERVADDRQIENETERLGANPITDLATRLGRAVEARDELMRWITLCRGIADARTDGLGPLLDAYDEAGEPYLGVVDAYDRVLHRSLARRALEQHPEIGETHSLSFDDIRRRFQDLDKRIMDMRLLELIATLAATHIPQGIQSPRKGECTEATLIRNEIAKKKRHIPLRDLIDRASNAIRAMKPCAMMSPSSVAQFIKPDQRFDLVIIDEASQMRPEESISALARAKQAVIVGDPQQLPPSNFFSRQEVDDPTNNDEEFEKVVAESILDVARSAFQPPRELLWHYRSRHGSLIAFSNRHFYDDRLIVFPSPQEGHPDYGVRFIPVDGQYRASVNVPEANAVALEVIDFMAKNPDKSLGVVALNQPQRDLILAEMDRLFVRNTVAENYRARWAKTLEPFFVKNLENVQGDERDVIFISTVYGPDEAGNLMQRFGPINGAAGDRRLNVLFSRAKHGVTVFSSMRPDQIRVDANTPRGTRLLKEYLIYAATGQLDTGTRTYHDCDSDFERFVKERLEIKGYEVVAQVGVAGFRIDLGVRHPQWPFGFLLGIECDGAAYHSSLSARDRDRLRQQILESLGWTIYRVWSTDWFRDPNRELKRMIAFIEQTLHDSLARRADEFAKHKKLVSDQQIEQDVEDLSSPFETLNEVEEEDGENPPNESVESPTKTEPKDTLTSLSPFPSTPQNSEAPVRGKLGVFKEATYDDLDQRLHPDRFFDTDYEATLAVLIDRCVTVEGPIRDDVLARRIGRLHDFRKAGSKIRTHVTSIAAKFFHATAEDNNRFFWPADATPADWVTFRRADGESRPTEEIAMEELQALALVVHGRHLGDDEDFLVVMSREAGLKRLRAPSRERLKKAMLLALNYKKSTNSTETNAALTV